MNHNVRIASIGTSLPPCRIHQKQALSILLDNYKPVLTPRSLSVVEQLFSHPGIEKRNFAFNHISEIAKIIDEHPDIRVNRFIEWSVKLSSEAVKTALQKISLSSKDISCLIVNTCTGYVCPGLSTYLVQALNLRADTKVFDMVGAGCGGAIPNIQLGLSLAALGETVLCVAVEICSATFEMGNDINLLLSNALFSDGAAAIVLWNRPQGVNIIDSSSHILPQFREDIRYVHKNGRLHNQLSPHLPKLIRDNVPVAVNNLLSKHNLSISQVKHWAIHPGGDKILTYIQEKLQISDELMYYSRSVLKSNGNMSSPTVLFILNKLFESNSLKSGDWGFSVAFGAGLSIYTLLLQWPEQ